jgi:predicted NAD/FAD-dependent oxidoreductase
MNRNSIAVVGAGMAGLACAGRLATAGWSVRLFEKSAGVGGRMASRRVALADGREISFDHGAQYATARDRDFTALCAALEQEGDAGRFPWPVFSQTKLGADSDGAAALYVGVPGMNAIPQALARSHLVTLHRTVSSLSRSSSGWRLGFAEAASEGGFAAIVLAVPAEQAAHLLAGVSAVLAQEAQAARTAPCWAGLFAFEGGGEPAFGAIRVDDGGPLCWLARTADGQGWVAHASHAWSRLNLELSPDAAAAALEVAVRAALPDVGATLVAQAHRWRFAEVEAAAGSSHVWDASLGLGVCGDWRLGPRIELAWRSGNALGCEIAADAAYRPGGAVRKAAIPGA